LLVLNTSVYAQRGTIFGSPVPLATLTPEQIMQNLQLNMDELSYALINLFTYKSYSVQAVKIIYTTIDGKGNPTIASGVVFLPVVESNTYLPVVEYLPLSERIFSGSPCCTRNTKGTGGKSTSKSDFTKNGCRQRSLQPLLYSEEFFV